MAVRTDGPAQEVAQPLQRRPVAWLVEFVLCLQTLLSARILLLCGILMS